MDTNLEILQYMDIETIMSLSNTVNDPNDDGNEVENIKTLRDLAKWMKKHIQYDHEFKNWKIILRE